MLPAGKPRGANVALRRGFAGGEPEAVGADQATAVAANERNELVLATSPAAPVSAKPAEITHSARVPFRSAASRRFEDLPFREGRRQQGRSSPE